MEDSAHYSKRGGIYGMNVKNGTKCNSDKILISECFNVINKKNS